MSEWARVSPLLGDALARFLGDVLPELGGAKWWRNHVVMQLTPMQAQMVEQLPEGQLRGLDLAALLRVTARNWSEIAFKRQAPRELKRLIQELQDARHRHAHAPIDGVPLHEHRQHIDTALRFMTALNTDKALLWPIKQILSGMDDAEPTTPNRCEKETEEQRPKEPSKETEVAAPVAAGWLIGSNQDRSKISDILLARTFLGIDFGTSTTVVSMIDMRASGLVEPITLSLDQPGEHGDSIRHHLVNTVLANIDGKVIFGRAAYEMRQNLFEGKDVFSSFKMRLGVDIGPIYPATSLRRDNSATPVETAQDAALQFFRNLRYPVARAVQQHGKAAELHVAVTVPASFEANQRRDLLQAMSGLGMPADRICMIDEPNAAFLSCLHESAIDPRASRLLDRLRTGPMNVLVYDFGAGTCDISILEVQLDDGRLRSKNRAISRFTALGGDDLDRAIARNTLLPQLLTSAVGYEPTQREIDERLIPWLQPTAEKLKIAAMKWATSQRLKTLRDFDGTPPVFRENPIRRFKFSDVELSLDQPTLPFDRFVQDVEPFFGVFDPDESRYHVFAPVADAIQKSGLDPQNIDTILFIGGSAGNSLVQHAVTRMLPETVEAIVPRDLQTHVSLGAALHSIAYHGLSLDLIRPITSEPIMVITKGGGMETVVPAGTEVPTANHYETTLVVDRPGQQVIELPVCVSNDSKLLGLLRLESSSAAGFRLGAKVDIRASLTHDKLLNISAVADGVRMTAQIVNPLANTEVSRTDTAMLEAKQDYNSELLQTRGWPSTAVVLRLADAASAAGAYELAADMFRTAQRIDPELSHETAICHAYFMAGKRRQAAEWAKKAYERSPASVSAYNLSVFAEGDEALRLLREAVAARHPVPRAIYELGRVLKERGDPDGIRLLERCVAGLQQKLDAGDLPESDCRVLEDAALLIGKRSLAEHARARRESIAGEYLPYDEDNLVSAGGQSVVAAGVQ